MQNRASSLLLITGLVATTAALHSGLNTPSRLAVDVDPTDWLRECVAPYHAVGFKLGPFREFVNWSNYYQLAMPHGLCTDALACAFERCQWTDNATAALAGLPDLSTATIDQVSQYLPPLNLPAQIAFPSSVAELAQVVKNANSNSQRITIKTGGHSYYGSSTGKGSVNINMRGFPKYSATQIKLCDTSDDDVCKLARARNKTAAVRVGGGELFDDLYRAVIDWNAAAEHLGSNRAYQVVGGGAGTVSAAGGWLQGGGLATGLERLYGFGVDQVLQIEMVLPDGEHVKFGPSQWVTQQGMLYPQTTKLDGHCNAHVDKDESKWSWVPCRQAIDFAALWFAVRGGGGGTYGVVTAVHYQLHKRWDLQMVFVNKSVASEVLQVFMALPKADQDTFEGLWYDFFIGFLFEPAVLGVSESDSNGCGSAGFTLALTPNLFGASFSGLWCKSSAAQALLRAWRHYVSQNVVPKIPALARFASLVQAELAVVEDWKTYPQKRILENVNRPRAPIGHVPDTPGPTLQSDLQDSWSAAIPIRWLIQENRTAVHGFFKCCMTGAHVVGGNTATAHDGKSSMPAQVRAAGIQASVADFPQYGMAVAPWRNLIRPFLDGEKAGEYPADTEYNHMAPNMPGPLRTNFSAPCPAGLTTAQQNRQCVTQMESVWGAAGLARLGAIKQQVDPKHLFDCYMCVGNVDSMPPGSSHSECKTNVDCRQESYCMNDSSKVPPYLCHRDN